MDSRRGAYYSKQKSGPSSCRSIAECPKTALYINERVRSGYGYAAGYGYASAGYAAAERHYILGGRGTWLTEVPLLHLYYQLHILPYSFFCHDTLIRKRDKQTLLLDQKECVC